MRRKSKSSGSVSANGDDGSAVSKSSKKSFLGKVLKKKSKKEKSSKSKSKSDASSQNENDTAMINQSQEVERSQADKSYTKNGGEAKKPYMLKIALLLVDAKTRRFELLQLEFDSDKALVSDALSQIPIHVTEKVLSSQTYTGVCGANGIERKRSVPLFDFCKGNDVLVAIPSGTSAEECARLAKPILSDEKVIGMLSTSGINADPWTTAPIAAPRSSSSSRSRQAPKAREEGEKKSGSYAGFFYAVIGVLILAALAYWYKTRPVLTGDAAASGEGAQAWSGPQVDLEPVWNSCYAACDASKGFVERFIVSPPAKEG